MMNHLTTCLLKSNYNPVWMHEQFCYVNVIVWNAYLADRMPFDCLKLLFNSPHPFDYHLLNSLDSFLHVNFTNEADMHTPIATRGSRWRQQSPMIFLHLNSSCLVASRLNKWHHIGTRDWLAMAVISKFKYMLYINWRVLFFNRIKYYVLQLGHQQ